MEIDKGRFTMYQGCCRLLAGLLFLAFFFSAGCGYKALTGIAYKNLTLPLTKNMDATPCEIILHADGSILNVKEPFSGYGVQAKLHSNAIGDIAIKNGMNKIYFADKEIFSILGIWTSERCMFTANNREITK